MKRFSITAAAASILLLFFTTASLTAQEKVKKDWDAYSKELVKSLKSPIEGVKLSAMQRIIQYSDSLEVAGGGGMIWDIFKNNKNQKVRQLALVALSKMDNSLYTGKLSLHYRFEENQVIKNQLAFFLLKKGKISFKDFWYNNQVAQMSR